MRRAAFLMLILCCSLFLSGCAFQRSVKVPIDTLSYRQEGANNKILFVFLPGRRDAVDRFEREGFIRMVNDVGIPADVVAVDAHLGYYYGEQIVPRLKDDVMVPARAAGYERIWLVGISLGGFGALWYDRDYPGDAAGLVLLAPFLGYSDIIDEVAAAGGVRQWEPGPSRTKEYQRELWRMVKGYGRPERSSGRVYLGYGLKDNFARPVGMFAAILPPEQVLTADGGHDWATWRTLWSDMLARPEFRRAVGN
jgi:pimeloyl-ACP methyl ester carboxylesterase